MESYLHTAGGCRDKTRNERGILTVYALVLLLYLGGVAALSIEAYHWQHRQMSMLEEEIRREAVIYSGIMNWEVLYSLSGRGGLNIGLHNIIEGEDVNIICDIEEDIFTMKIIIENLSCGRVKTYEMNHEPDRQLSVAKE